MKNDLFKDFVATRSHINSNNHGNIGFKNNYISYEVNFFNSGNGLSYCAHTTKCNNELKLKVARGERDYYSIFFNHKGSPNVIKSKDKTFILNEGQMCISSAPRYDISRYYKSGAEYNTQTIVIDKNLADRLNISKLITKFEFGTTNITLKQRQIFHELSRVNLLNSEFQGLFLEAIILELIYYICDDNSLEVTSLSNDEIKTLNKAKDIITTNMQNPPSIKQLAKMCATNEYKLKKEFKEYFGNTIYGLLQEKRLEKSKVLLEMNDISIKEAANLVGYASMSHFSKIFKERFGVFPSWIRKK